MSMMVGMPSQQLIAGEVQERIQTGRYGNKKHVHTNVKNHDMNVEITYEGRQWRGKEMYNRCGPSEERIGGELANTVFYTVHYSCVCIALSDSSVVGPMSAQMLQCNEKPL
jgi:hypothetical protein